jgi:hypothetical protein
MWKITTRGFTLEEVLIMAAMNLLTSADSGGTTASLQSNADQFTNAAERPSKP